MANFVLVPGAGEHAASWNRLIPELETRCHRAIACRQQIQQMSRFAAVGTPAQVTQYLNAFVTFADADELIVGH